MSTLFGVLGLPDTDRSYVNTIGQRIVYDAVQTLIDEYEMDLAAAKAIFVENSTPEYKLRYKLPGGGRLQRRGGLAQSGAVKATGQWDIALPLEDFGAQVAGDDVTLAYMTLQELQRHIATVFAQNTNTTRFEMLKAILNN